MTGACKLNNKTMRNIRRDQSYQCMAIDLAMLGVISKEECEMLIGSGIPKNLMLPNGEQGNLVSEEKLPEQPVVTEEPEPEETEEPESEETEEPEPEETENDEGRAESDN